MKHLMAMAVALAAASLMAAERPAKFTPPEDGALQNAAQTTLGATATFVGAPNNRDWPANNAIPEENMRRLGGGVMFGSPMAGGTMDIRLIVPCEIERIDLMQLDYHGTMCPKTVALSVDGKSFGEIVLEDWPGRFQSFPLKVKGQVVTVKCVDTFDRETLPNGEKGPNWGGWARVRVMVKDDVKALMQLPASYVVAAKPAALCPTGTAANGPVKVFGAPRMTKGHPCTTWDGEDVARFRGLLATCPEFKRQAEGLRNAMDRRITQPVAVPQPRKNDKGEWVHISDTEVGRIHNALGLDIANLGTAYQLFRDDRYAEYCRKLLLAYAEAYPNYGIGARPGFNHDPSKVFDQRLSDGTWLIQVAIGYDLIYNYRGITDEDRRRIERDFIADSGKFITLNRHTLNGATNWSAIDTAAVLIAGYATDDQELIETAMYGWNKGRNPSKWWEGTPNAKPSGIELHFSGQSIDVDGMWTEGAMGYQFMALQALVLDAEILWHHGIDLYSYRGCAMKAIFDSPLLFAYPNLVSPAIHDSGNASIVGWDSYLYEYGYLRYRDPAYLQVLTRINRRLGASFQQFTVSTLWDTDLTGELPPIEPKSVNLNGVGYGILRVTDGEGTRSLLLDYGPNRSHGHPDKLNIDLWGFGDLLVNDPGCVWYEQPIYRNWYRTTLAHNTLNVDTMEQMACGAELLVYAPGDANGIQRGRTDGAASGVMMDRSLFMTAQYVADLFGAFGRLPRLYDLSWHPVGECVAAPAAEDYRFAEPRPRGYSELKNAKRVVTAASVRTEFERKGRRFALIAAPGDETEHIVAKASIQPGKPDQTPVLERRRASETVYGNVIDYSNGGFVKSVASSGSAEDGWKSLAIGRADGGEDWCYASYRDGARTADGVATDAQQAFLRFGPKGTLECAILGGGTSLAAERKLSLFRTGRFSVARSAPGSVVVERTETGSYLVRNASTEAAEITVRVPEEKTFSLKAGETAEFLVGGAKPVAAFRREMLRKLQADAAAAAAKAKAEQDAKAAARAADAAKFPIPDGTVVVVQAEDFTSEGEGKVRIADNKTAAVGNSLSGWDNDGHWMEWKVDIPVAGYYSIAPCYCTNAKRERRLLVNGTCSPEAEIFSFEGTGGFANGNDDWRVVPFADPGDAERAMTFKFEKGENVIRMVNVGGGGMNMDYFFFYKPGKVPARLK